MIKKVYAIKEVVGDRYLGKAQRPDNEQLKYTFHYKSVGDSVETFDTVDEAIKAYNEYLEHHAITPFILQEIFVAE